MSKRTLSVLIIMVVALLAAACGPSATATPKPTVAATTAAEAATAEVTAEATKEATTAPTAEATKEATTEATAEATKEATTAPTAEATKEATKVEATKEVTAAALAAATEATQEATPEATATVKPTTAPTATEKPTTAPTATVKPTLEPTAVPAEATAEATESGSAGGLIPVRLQLQWVAQSQFAGYYAAAAEGYYKDEGLDVTILEGGPDIIPQTVVAGGGAEFGIAWVPKVLASREQGADLVNIAQVFQRSGTLEISFKDKGIESVADLKGKNVGSWLGGNEDELFAALLAQGIDPNKDVTIVKQNFDMAAMLSGELDAAEAMTYNEYAQVLEQVDPATGKLYSPDDINIINFNDVGTAMLQDHIFALGTWLDGTTNGVKNTDIAVKFIRASLKGWIYARDHFDETVDIVLKNGPTLGKGHMAWQLNEINKLIWPSPNGVGVLDTTLWAQTVKEAIAGKIITKAPDSGAYRTGLAQNAVNSLKADGVDVTGTDYKPETVTITPGGE